MTDETPLPPAQVVARREIEAIYMKVGAQRENPPSWEHEAMLRWLDELRLKAWPSEEPPSAPGSSISAEALASVKILHPEGDFSVREGESIPMAPPMPIVRSLAPQQISRLLGASEWEVTHGAALLAGKRRRPY